VSDAREEILRRVRSALRDVPAGERSGEVAVARDYRRHDDRSGRELINRFVQRLEDYHATVRRVAPEAVGPTVGEACQELGLRRIAVPWELPAPWRPQGVDVLEDRDLTIEELDRLDGAVTGCATAIAETGTLVLDGEGVSGRRAITLVPDHHICIVIEDQVLGLVPEALEHVAPAVTERGLPITLISGPSASSDIELTRVEGVHGPRHLLVLIVGDA
jgi:L-lactate dehydrogenase complex protein LldG